MTPLLRDLFNTDFAGLANPEAFCRVFFEKTLTIADMHKVFDTVRRETVEVSDYLIPAAIRIPGKTAGAPFIILAQLHGNEPAGEAAILLAMALSGAGLLEHDVIGAVGNPLAAAQYFVAYEKDPKARQETRDMFRAGVDAKGELLPDGNRIPVDFLKRQPDTPHIKRAQELYTLAQHARGIADIHSARGNMLCITDYKHERELRYSPIRAVLTDLADAISANASGAVTVQTLKTILSPLPNIEWQVGIEAGRHEDPKAPPSAAAFALALLYNIGFTAVPPLAGTKENGVFERYSVKPRITYADLAQEGTVQPGDNIYMAHEAKPGEKALVTVAGKAYAAHQYDEMEAIRAGTVVAVAVPSGTLFRAKHDFSGIFLSKAAELYDKDPAVGPWPVPADKIASTKFCYPCHVSPWHIHF